MKRGEWRMESGGLECGEWSAEHKVWRVELKVESREWRMQSGGCGKVSVENGVGSGGVESVVWRVDCGKW